MCLRLRHAEAKLWRREGLNLFEKAFCAARTMDVDPLLTGVPLLSRLVSAIDSVKKRHGLLIERALIDSINKVPDWSARKIRVPVGTTHREIDCVAYNAATATLYLFECKRGHGAFDRAAIDAIDRRLDDLVRRAPAYAAVQGWSPTKIDTFILSFYGRKWPSRFPILDMNEAAGLFPPCAAGFATEFRDFIEGHGSERAEQEARDALGVDVTTHGSQTRCRYTLFDAVEAVENIGRDVVISSNGWKFMPPQIDSFEGE